MKLKTLLLPSAGDVRIALALLILRLFVGAAFIQHGSGKLTRPAEFAAEFGTPVRLAFVTMFTRLISGILSIIGATTRLAALAIAGTVITATKLLIQPGEPSIKRAGHIWKNSPFDLIAGICQALSGAGSVSRRLAVWSQRFERLQRGFANAPAARSGN